MNRRKSKATTVPTHRSQIANFTSDLQTGRVSWSWGGAVVSIVVPELTHALPDSAGRNVYVLSDRADNRPLHLSAYTFDGKRLFCVTAPEGFTFSYLTHHPDAPIAVVATGAAYWETFPDWHFSISDTGELKRLAPAY